MIRSAYNGSVATILRWNTPYSNMKVTSSLTPLFRNSSTSTKKKDTRVGPGVPAEEMPFHHFFPPKGRNAKGGAPKPKFISPRKHANKMFTAINQEAIEKSRDTRPNVHDVPFRVGDAIE